MKYIISLKDLTTHQTRVVASLPFADKDNIDLINSKHTPLIDGVYQIKSVVQIDEPDVHTPIDNAVDVSEFIGHGLNVYGKRGMIVDKSEIESMLSL